MITDIEDYFAKGCGRCDRFASPDCATQHWFTGLAHLRRLCQMPGLTETVRWGHPCYRHADRNIAIIGAHLHDFQLSFFNAALMTDPKGILERQGPNASHPDMIRFTDVGQVAQRAPIITAYLVEAMGYARDGIKPPKESTDITLPDELVTALDTDPELAEAFHNLTPGRQKSFVINLNTAKRVETRVARIVKFRDKILAGKGATER